MNLIDSLVVFLILDIAFIGALTLATIIEVLIENAKDKRKQIQK